MERDEDRPVRKPEVPIGDDLALLSVAELEWRIGVLRQEIMRLEFGDHRQAGQPLGRRFRVQTVTSIRRVNHLVSTRE